MSLIIIMKLLAMIGLYIKDPRGHHIRRSKKIIMIPKT